MKIDTILFDMDGVLIDSEGVIIECCIDVLKEYGVNAVKEDFAPFYGMGEDSFIGGVSRKHGVEYTLEMKDKAYNKYCAIVKDVLGHDKTTINMLKKLKELGFKMAVASSADSVKVRANLNAIDAVDGIFDSIVTGSDIINKKPDPEIYIKAYKSVNSLPENCVVVEDAPSGIQAGNTAGILTIGVTSSFSKEALEKHNPDYIVSKTPEIIDLLLKINNQ